MNGTTAVSQRPVLELPTPSARRLLRAAHVVLGLAVAAGVVGVVLPRVVGTTLSSVGVALGRPTALELTGLLVLWFAGLFTHSFVLTGALPRLSRRRALMLNLTGSSVANVLPFGGPVGVSLNYLMVRSWGYRADEFASYALVTTAFSLVVRLVMPAVGLVALIAVGGHVVGTLRWSAFAAAFVLVLLVASFGVALASRPLTARVAGAVAPVALRLGRAADRGPFVDGVLGCRDRMTVALRDRWAQMSTAMLGYAVLQAVLLGACLASTGAHPSPSTVLIGYAVDRALTFAVVSPGGAGLNEAATAGTLVALGTPAPAAIAGVLLYRGLTFALEIPVGGSWLCGWLLHRRAVRGRSVG